jgi:hypothetical protein
MLPEFIPGDAAASTQDQKTDLTHICYPFTP